MAVDKVAKMQDLASLGKMATSHTNSGVRIAAVKKVTDESVLAKVASDDADETVATTAIEKITAVATLRMLSDGSKWPSVRAGASAKLQSK